MLPAARRLRLMRRPQRWIALREHPLPRHTLRVRLPDCEALDAAQVFGFAMKHPVGRRIEASSTSSQRSRHGWPKKQLGP